MTTEQKFEAMTTFTAAEMLATCQKIHGTARSKGWWTDGPDGRVLISEDDVDEKLFLVVTELAEAFEEYRASKGDDDLRKVYYIAPTSEPGKVAKFSAEEASAILDITKAKPEGFPIEMADAYIRILDLTGAVAPNLDLSTVILYMTDADRYISKEFEKTTHMGRTMCEITRALVTINDGDTVSVLKALFLALGLIEVASKDLNFSLRSAIELKMAYNDTRSFKHGGKRA